jgi:hypothetical protein
MYRAGMLRFVHPPTAELEGLRDLLRARDDLRCARMAARHEDFEDNTAAQAAQRALDAAEKWIEPDRRNRTYRIHRLLPAD